MFGIIMDPSGKYPMMVERVFPDEAAVAAFVAEYFAPSGREHQVVSLVPVEVAS